MSGTEPVKKITAASISRTVACPFSTKESTGIFQFSGSFTRSKTSVSRWPVMDMVGSSRLVMAPP